MDPFFIKPEPPKYLEIATRLQQYLDDSMAFNIAEQAHITLVSDSGYQVKQTLVPLRNLDLKIVASFVVGVAAFSLAFILPFMSSIAMCALGYCMLCIGKRKALEITYRNSLNNLIGCCEWVLSKVKGKKQDVLACQAVTDMIDTLAPLTSPDQLRRIIDDSIEDHCVERAKYALNQAAEKDNFANEILGRPLNQKERNLYFSIYGFKQGNVTDVVKGSYYLSAQGAKWVKKSVSDLFKKHSEASSANAPTSTSTLIP